MIYQLFQLRCPVLLVIAFFVERFINLIKLLIDGRMKDDSYIRGCKRTYLNLGLDGGFAQQAVNINSRKRSTLHSTT
jgi:hypothetical protein